MYRDSATALDEHDRAVGAILIGEALVDECERAQELIRRGELDHNERWRTITGVHDTYPEVWRHLDRARRLLANRGANTTSYDELRPHARPAPTNGEGDIDNAALQDARRAIEDLKLAVPGADWGGIRERTADLAEAKLTRAHGPRTVTVALVSLFVTVLIGWLVALIPERRPDPREVMRRELDEVAAQRKVRISTLRFELGLSCDVERARELVKLLALDGRVAEARVIGLDYIQRCGDDEAVDNWAHAPAPPRRD